MRCRGIVLCSGSSRRMGEPKALLRLNQETFLERIVRVFREGGIADNIVVVGGPDSDAIRSAHDAAIRFVHNPDPSRGPISSVQAGIQASMDATGDPIEAFLIHPVDIPGIGADDIAAVLDGAADAPESAAVIPSVGHRRAHPVLIRGEVITQVLGEEITSLREILASRTDIHHVDRANTLLRLDVDTPDDYQILLAALEVDG